VSGEVIVAIASAPGVGAVSLIRASGEGVVELCAGALQSRLGVEQMEPRKAYLAKVEDRRGDILDEVLVTVFRGPKSFTGEDVVEFACHGGVLVTKSVLSRLLELGARSAAPGEFSQRAFENGKMDLSQAEAIMDLISAQTELAMRAAHEQMQGKLGDQSEKLRESMIEVVAHVEAYIDFPEEDIDPATGDDLVRKMDEIER